MMAIWAMMTQLKDSAVYGFAVGATRKETSNPFITHLN